MGCDLCGATLGARGGEVVGLGDWVRSGDWRGFWGGGRVDEGEFGDGDGCLDWVV